MLRNWTKLSAKNLLTINYCLLKIIIIIRIIKYKNTEYLKILSQYLQEKLKS